MRVAHRIGPGLDNAAQGDSAGAGIDGRIASAKVFARQRPSATGERGCAAFGNVRDGAIAGVPGLALLDLDHRKLRLDRALRGRGHIRAGFAGLQLVQPYPVRIGDVFGPPDRAEADDRNAVDNAEGAADPTIRAAVCAAVLKQFAAQAFADSGAPYQGIGGPEEPVVAAEHRAARTAAIHRSRKRAEQPVVARLIKAQHHDDRAGGDGIQMCSHCRRLSRAGEHIENRRGPCRRADIAMMHRVTARETAADDGACLIEQAISIVAGPV